MAAYAHPDVLVETDWVKKNLKNPGVRIVEIDVDTMAYEAGHIPGAVALNWQTQLQDTITRDIVSKHEFERLLSAAGISPTDTVILYGDNNNWFACYGYWLFKLYGHKDVRMMNGGRMKWLNESDAELTTDVPAPKPTTYKVTQVNDALRARVTDVMDASRAGAANLIDVRSPDEFSGKVIAPPGMNETAQRGGHIPSATSIPWSNAVNPDGTFKSADELRQLYVVSKGVDPSRPTITYCRIGERSSHTWFVCKYLIGLDNVRNYDGSWTEYGNLVGAPIEK